MADRLSINYDKRRDVLYVSKGDGGTLNLPFTHNQDVQLDEDTYDVVGYIITNFSHVYPGLFSRLNPKDRWFVREYFVREGTLHKGTVYPEGHQNLFFTDQAPGRG